MGRIITKKIQSSLAAKRLYNYGRQSKMVKVYNFKDEEDAKTSIKENNEINTEDKVMMMSTNEKIELANAILDEKPQTTKAKRIKVDKGLIERKENTIILTEDNRELLND